MVRAILASRFAPLAVALAAVIFLACQVHHSFRLSKHAVKTRTPPDQTMVQIVPVAVPFPVLLMAPTGARAPKELSHTSIIQSPITAVSEKVEDQKELALKTPPAAVSPAPIEIASNSAGATTPSPAPNVLTLLANFSKEASLPGAEQARKPAGPNRIRPAEPPATEAMTMTMLSISSVDEGSSAPRTLSVRCRTSGYISNATARKRIVVKGVVTEDVVSPTGKILIPAGSKVAGIGQVDCENGRLQSHANWSIFAENRELRVLAEIQDENSGFPGIVGKETSFESELSQRQAVVRDGRYFFLADKTPFILLLKGEVGLKELKTLEKLE
jgi:type IV secretory pathway VirB10-like protein